MENIVEELRAELRRLRADAWHADMWNFLFIGQRVEEGRVAVFTGSGNRGCDGVALLSFFRSLPDRCGPERIMRDWPEALA